MTGERCGCEESWTLRAELERLKAVSASPRAGRGAPHVIGRPGEAYSSAAKHSSDLLNRLSDPCVHLSGRDYEAALTATEHRDAAIASAAYERGRQSVVAPVVEAPESAESLYKRLGAAGLTCWQSIDIIEADRAAIATAADRAGYERALRDIARHPECVSIRHVCEALRQMPSTAAPAGEGGA